MQYKEEILRHIREYLELKDYPKKMNKKFKNKLVNLKCLYCNPDKLTASIISTRHVANCLACNKSFNIIDLARNLETNFNDKTSEEEILNYLKDVLKIKVMTKTDEEDLDKFFDKYMKWGFDLVPIVANEKFPIEKDWTNKEHKDKTEWLEWIKNGLNIGVKTGKKSDIMIIDVDQKPTPKEIDSIKGNCLVQESTNGFHLIYKYDKDFPKTRVDELKVDIEAEGGQVVIYPSTINNVQRKFINIPDEITEMPKELKAFLLPKITVTCKTDSEKLREDIETEDFKIDPKKFALKNNQLEGNCNTEFIKLGGILRKQLNSVQTGNVLNILNRHMLETPMQQRAINAMIREVDKYSQFDERELAHKVLEYLKDVEEANRTEIAMAIVNTNRGEDKKRIDKALTYLVKEGNILKKGRSYGIIQKANWKTNLINIGTPIDFKMPYFYNIMDFNFGDLLLIGSRNATGKTHISMNIIKQLAEQKLQPYYLSLESGSRWAKIGLQLGLKEGDFKWDELADSTIIELEKDAITVIDWLCPNNYAETDKLIKYFTKQLQKNRGVAIVFVQLRDNNEWLAKDLIKQFPSFACRYVYDNEGDGEYGKFIIDKMREPKIRVKHYEIPCRYDWVTKELKMQEEIENEKAHKKD